MLISHSLPHASDYHFRFEQNEDNAPIENLYDQVFGPGRYTRAAHFVREICGVAQDLSLVCVHNGAHPSQAEELVSSIRFSEVCFGKSPALILGPLVVSPSHRNKGFGKALMSYAIENAWAKGHNAIVLVGDEPYYRALGFKALPFGAVQFPAPVDPARVLGLAKSPEDLLALKGAVRAAECV